MTYLPNCCWRGWRHYEIVDDVEAYLLTSYAGQSWRFQDRSFEYLAAARAGFLLTKYSADVMHVRLWHSNTTTHTAMIQTGNCGVCQVWTVAAKISLIPHVYVERKLNGSIVRLIVASDRIERPWKFRPWNMHPLPYAQCEAELALPEVLTAF